MKVYNETKTELLTSYDLEKGYLNPDKLLVRTVPEQLEQSHEVRTEYPETGGVDIEVVIDVPYRAAYDEYEDIQIYIPYTEEQLQNMRISEIKTRLTALSEDIVQDLAGEVVPNIAERKAEFIALHNELRELIGLEPREVKP